MKTFSFLLRTNTKKMPRKFVSLETVLRNLRGKHVVMEHRPKRYKFGCVNYGEVVPNWYNPADGDKYDVVAPEYDHTLPIKTAFQVTSVLGILWLSNGNHKIFVKIDHPGYQHARAMEEIHRFSHEYPRRMRLDAIFLNHTPARASYPCKWQCENRRT